MYSQHSRVSSLAVHALLTVCHGAGIAGWFALNGRAELKGSRTPTFVEGLDFIISIALHSYWDSRIISTLAVLSIPHPVNRHSELSSFIHHPSSAHPFPQTPISSTSYHCSRSETKPRCDPRSRPRVVTLARPSDRLTSIIA